MYKILIFQLQERLLNSNSSNLLQQQQENLSQMHSLRAESTPPTLSALNQSSAAFNRARSEQPLNISMPLHQSYHVPNLAPIYQQQQQQQQAQQSPATNNFQQQNIAHSQLNSVTSQQIQRNNHAINMNMNNRNLARNIRSASTLATTTNNTIYEQQIRNQHQQQQHHPNNATSNCYFQNAEQVQANSFMNLNNQFETNDLETNLLNIRQNNVSTSSTTNSNLTYQNLLNNNQMYQQPPQGPVPSMSNVSPQHQQQPTLNNQVSPGIRANNYWDNFRR